MLLSPNYICFFKLHTFVKAARIVVLCLMPSSVTDWPISVDLQFECILSRDLSLSSGFHFWPNSNTF